MEQRALKLDALRAAGVEPYFATSFRRTHMIGDLRAQCEPIAADGIFPTDLKIAGRIMAVRDMGKSIFVDLEDQSGKIQLYLNPKELDPAKFAVFKSNLERGDFVGVFGNAMRMRTGELTVKVSDFNVLCKSLRPLPDKFAGLQDPEVMQRQRYLDLAASPEVRTRFSQRSEMIHLMRQFLHAQAFMEVETPILQVIHGGASARPFVTHHNALNMEQYLRIATELHLKRCVVGGFERVFEMGRIFRNEGLSRRHNPEFTTIEIYWAYADCDDMLSLTEASVAYIVDQIHHKLELPYQGSTIDFTPPWQRLTMDEAILKFGGIDSANLDLVGLQAAATAKGVDFDPEKSRGLLVEHLFDALAQAHLIRPTFITRYPVETSPLAKRYSDNPDYIERFEAFINGIEIANAFSEANDPLDIRLRFEEQVAQIEAGDEEAQPLDEDFIQAMEVGMPPTGGLGIGMDRLAMFLTDSASIRDVLLFPTMRRQNP